MSNLQREIPPAKDGFSEWQLDSWDQYMALFSDSKNGLGVMANQREFIFRGQRDASWELTSSLNRLLGETNKRTLNQNGIGTAENISTTALSSIPTIKAGKLLKEHSDNFKKAIRGMTKVQEMHTLLSDEEELWAIGQHHGLASPLLDWTASPFVAAFFAYEEKGNDEEKSNECEKRIIYALDKDAIEGLSSEGAKSENIKIIRPMLGENKRVLSQAGLFVSIPPGINLEDWVKRKFKDKNEYVLIKISVPSNDRQGILKQLNRFNINHLSLFPDMIGAAKYCNLHFEIDNY